MNGRSNTPGEPERETDPTPGCKDFPGAIIQAGPKACAAWTQFTTDEGWRPSTRKVYRQTAGRFLRWLETEDIGLADVMPRDIEQFLDGQAVSDRSKPAYRTAIRRCFDALLAHAAVAAAPADAAGLKADDWQRTAFAELSAATAAAEEQLRLAEMRAAIRELDAAAMDDDPELLDAGVVLLAGFHLGTAKLAPISRYTGISPRRVAKFAERLRANGIWTDDGKTAVEWQEDDEACIGLLIYILVATGMVERCGDAPEPAASEGAVAADAGNDA